MIETSFLIEENRCIARRTFELCLTGDTAGIGGPGTFVQLALPGFYLRRPISVCSCTDGMLTLIYKVVGKGTEYLCCCKPGTSLNLLGGLGRGYDTAVSGQVPLLVGGGVGVPPLYGLAEALLREGKHPKVLLGFATAAEAFYEEHFKELSCDTVLYTEDASSGKAGLVTSELEFLAGHYSYVYACGPYPMLRAVYKLAMTSGQYSLEERMGCGFGACMGCSIPTTSGPKRVCTSGPVFLGDEILWDR